MLFSFNDKCRKSFDNKNKMYQNNILCMKNIISFCQKNKSKLIHISSTNVYGKQTDLVDETCEKIFKTSISLC